MNLIENSDGLLKVKGRLENSTLQMSISLNRDSHLTKHIHKKRKDSLETRAVFSWILILTWNFGGGQNNSASTFFKTASASWFLCYWNYNLLFYMLDNDNIISTSVSGAVEKIPTNEKDYRKCSFMCFTLHSHSIKRAD